MDITCKRGPVCLIEVVEYWPDGVIVKVMEGTIKIREPPIDSCYDNGNVVTNMRFTQSAP